MEVNNFDEGWKQALLQSVMCQKLNDSIPILSIVTTSDIWQFGKLEKSLFIRHPISAGVQHVEELLGILDLFFRNVSDVLLIK